MRPRVDAQNDAEHESLYEAQCEAQCGAQCDGFLGLTHLVDLTFGFATFCSAVLEPHLKEEEEGEVFFFFFFYVRD